jgi:hypothetical protein
MVGSVPVAHAPVHGDHLFLNWQVRFPAANAFGVDLNVPVEHELSLARGVESSPNLTERLVGRYPSLVPRALALEFAAVAHGSGPPSSLARLRRELPP